MTLESVTIADSTDRAPFAGVVMHFRALRDRWSFIRNRAAADRRARFIDRMLGAAWFLVAPVFEILTYYVLVAVIFRRTEFYGVPAFLGITGGLIHYWILQRAISRCIPSLVSQRQTMLQIKIEPMVFTAIAFLNEVRESRFHFLIFALAMVAYGFVPSWQIVFYPIVLLLLIVVSWSLSLLAATAYVFFRDVQELSNIALRLILYLSPVIYAVALVPEAYRAIYLLNPLATLFALIGACLLGFPPPPVGHIIWSVVFFVAIFFAAHYFYETSKRQFTKVM